MLKNLLYITFFLNLVPSLFAQAAYTASKRANIQVGVLGSAFTLDDNTGHEEGIGIYGDIDFTKHLGVELLYRDASIKTPHDVGENHLLVGPRYVFHRGPFDPYAKAVIGRGTINYQVGYYLVASSESYLTYALGGGLDLRAARHINVRLFDFEYQRWPNFPPHGLTPYGYSAGVAYHF